MAEFLVGELAARTGFSRSTIRYYESIGLLAPAVRSASGYRVYAQKVMEELRFVRRAQRLGFTLEEMTEVLRLHRQGRSPCGRVVQAAQTRLSAVERQLVELRAVRDELAAQISVWTDCTDVEEPNGRNLSCAMITCGDCPDQE